MALQAWLPFPGDRWAKVLSPHSQLPGHTGQTPSPRVPAGIKAAQMGDVPGDHACPPLLPLPVKHCAEEVSLTRSNSGSDPDSRQGRRPGKPEPARALPLQIPTGPPRKHFRPGTGSAVLTATEFRCHRSNADHRKIKKPSMRPKQQKVKRLVINREKNTTRTSHQRQRNYYVNYSLKTNNPAEKWPKNMNTV